MIFFELNWNPKIDLQAEDRVHRLTQTKTVDIFKIVMIDTIDQRIIEAQERKDKIANGVIHDQNSINQMDTTGLNKAISGEMNEMPEKEPTFKQLLRADIKYDKDSYSQMNH